MSINPPGESSPVLTAFQERFLSKLQKVDSLEIERFLTDVVRQKTFLQIVFDAMADGVVVLKQNLEVQYLNTPAIELLGLNPRSRILQQRLSALVPSEELRAILSRYALAPERMDSVEVQMRHRTEPLLLSISIVPLEKESSGGGSIVMVRDVTAARKALDEQRRSQQALTMATLSAGLAHEIKNPLNSLLLHAQLLRQSINELPKSRRKQGGPDRERMEISAGVIVDEIIRLNSKVNEFLAAVRPTCPTLESVRLPQLFEKISQTLQPELEAADIEFVTMCDHEIPVVNADPTHLIQIVQNLVKNSIEAIQDERRVSPNSTSQRRARIEIRAELVGASVALTVSDNGPGIPPHVLPRILEPYFTSKEMGTGLGLNLVSRMVEEHGGRLNVATRPIVDGTVMTVLLPLGVRPLRKINGDSVPQDGIE